MKQLAYFKVTLPGPPGREQGYIVSQSDRDPKDVLVHIYSVHSDDKWFLQNSLELPVVALNQLFPAFKQAITNAVTPEDRKLLDVLVQSTRQGSWYVPPNTWLDTQYERLVLLGLAEAYDVTPECRGYRIPQ